MQNKWKQLTQGIAFKTWLYYVLFSLCILGLIFVFQIILFEPYYESFKTKDIVISDLVEVEESKEETQWV